MKDIFTIELNLDGDFANACAYHVDSLQRTIRRNVFLADNKKATKRWVLVGLAFSLDEAQDKAEKLRNILCEKHNRSPYGMNELLEKMKDE